MKSLRYLLALVDGGGNVPPELSAARRLVERGHAVTVLAEDSVAFDVRATGATLRRWVRAPNRPDRRPENDPIRDWGASTRGSSSIGWSRPCSSVRVTTTRTTSATRSVTSNLPW